MSGTDRPDAGHLPAIALIGMAGRFPGARDVEAFWSNLRRGVHAVHFFDDEEQRAAGVPESLLADPAYVRATAVLDDIDRFDAAFFGFSPREAEVMDPQQRLFLETAWEALENAGYDPAGTGVPVGVYAGSSDSDYLLRHVAAHPEVVAALGGFQVGLANSKDFLATRVAHRLNLDGPALTVQTACSTGLVAVHVACQALLAGECDLALAGAVSVNVFQDRGYLYAPGGIGSPDGHCRAFDARAAGTVGGSGVGVVVLRRLADARAAGDTVRAVIRGSAVNNDGARKVGFTAPSVEGQALVIEEALAVAGVDPATVGYVEAHGTGTELGDPVEVAALTQAFGDRPRRQSCALGSVKTNIGHLDAAAGVAGLIKAALAVESGEVPPSLHYTAPNPRIDFAASPFFVAAGLGPWPLDGGPRRAGVSAFGIGGTNAHLVLEEAPAPAPSAPARPWHLLTLSARTPEALEEATGRLAAHLDAHPEQELADAAWTLQAGRRAWEHRRVVVARDGRDAARALAARDPERVATAAARRGTPAAAFLFPNLGSHYAGMGRGIYASEPVFRQTVDRCAEILRPHLGADLRDALYPAGAVAEERRATGAAARLARSAAGAANPGEALDATGMAQTALFVTEYALARLWMHWGVRPAALLAHSLGEYVAATLAGVWTLEDALFLAAERARLIEAQPAGGMMGLNLTEAETLPLLPDGVYVGTLNGADVTVVSGPAAAVDALQAELTEAGMGWRRLPLRHALHTPWMAPVAERLEALMRGMRLRAPSIPFPSTLTGTWIRDAEATDPAYWSRHLCEKVRFSDCVETLARSSPRLLVEMGPGHALRMLAGQLDVWGDDPPTIVTPLRHAWDPGADVERMLEAAGRFWAAGGAVDWTAVHAHERLRRVPLPTYPFQRERFWLDRRPAAPAGPPGEAAPRAPSADPADWLYLPGWAPAPPAAPSPTPSDWLVLADACGVGTRLAGRLEELGHTVAVAEAGEAFGRVGDRGWTARPGVAEDLEALRGALEDAGVRPRHVVHLWGIDPEGETVDDAFERAQRRGYATVAALAAAFARGGGPLAVVVVTDGVHDVAGGEGAHPGRAPVLGACLTLPLEHPAVACRTVDVRFRPGQAAALADRLVAEVAAGAPGAVALRGALRWAPLWRAARPPEDASGVRPDAALLFTGAVGAGSEVLAEHLAGSPGARVAVVVDPSFPGRGEWEGYLAAARVHDPVAATLYAVRDAEARGAQVLLLPAAAGDGAALREAAERAQRAFGRLDGVVHAVGAAAAGELAALAETRAAEAAAADLARAARELAALEAATDGLPLEWVLLHGSLVSAVGGVGRAAYAAHCALADAWAARRRGRPGPRWTSVGWDRWLPDGADDPAAAAAGRAIRHGEGARAWDRVAALAGEPRLVVCTEPPAARAERLRAPRGAPARPAGAAPAPAHPAPREGGAKDAPVGAAEEILAGMWRELLGVREIGVRDDFFHLGGHSLLGLQLISRIRETFRVELPLAALFEAPTVTALAELVDEAILLELEEMSDEEALELMGGAAA